MSSRRLGTRQTEAAARRRRDRQETHEYGIRPGVARALGFADETTSKNGEHDAVACDVFGCELCIALANAGAA